MRIAGLVAAVDSASQRIRSVMAALHTQMGGDRPAGPPHAKDHNKFIERHTELVSAMAAVLAPHADQLRVDAETGAAFIQTSVFASGMPMLGTRIADRATLTDLLVHALVKEPPCSATH